MRLIKGVDQKLNQGGSMSDLFYKRLSNAWHEIPSGLGYRFIVRATMDDGSVVVSQITILPAGKGFIEVDLFALTDPKYFTDGVVNNLYEDITRFVRHYYPDRRNVKCRATFGRTVVNREWNIRKEIKVRRLSWK